MCRRGSFAARQICRTADSLLVGKLVVVKILVVVDVKEGGTDGVRKAVWLIFGFS